MLTEERTISKDTLVLGFDASCGKCSQMARQLKAEVGGAVDILPLNNPDMREWRNQALEDAPWMPTLVRVGPDGKATGGWVGWKIGPVLGARLGPQKAAKALQNIGEQRLEANGGRIGAWTRSPVSRRGLGRVAVGMAGLAAGAVTVAGMAGSAFAKVTTPNLRVQDQEDLSTEDAGAQLERQMKSDDVNNVLPLSKMSAKTPAGAVSGDAESTEIGAKRMALTDGSQVSTISCNLSDRPPCTFRWITMYTTLDRGHRRCRPEGFENYPRRILGPGVECSAPPRFMPVPGYPSQGDDPERCAQGCGHRDLHTGTRGAGDARR